ncbi:MAG TPA: class I SAM-dependent methyltransferase [Pirellulales bacterium]|jgi:2-polyprenyl-3-methyl-5-hydroxy-6-metoxy-1,4-benzoquinol methylase
MAEEMTRESVGVGEHQEWNRIWEGLTDDEQIQYRRTAPVTYRQLYQRCYFEDLWSLLGRKRDARCLEIGAGRGTTSMYLTAEGCDVTMLDLAPQSFVQAERNFRREKLTVPTFVAADATKTGLPSDSYDCIYSIGLLEHFDDPRPLLTETLRLLRPGGLAFHVVVPTVSESRMWLSYALTAPWKLPPRRLKDWVNRVLGRKTKGSTDIMTRTEHDVADYVTWLADFPATDVICIPYNSYHPAVSSRAIERHWALPLYRAHRAVKRLIGRPPWTRTTSSLAMCVLVSFRKAGPST